MIRILTVGQKGSTVLVVDLGGGTGDSVAYRVVEDEPLKLEEACPKQGNVRI